MIRHKPAMVDEVLTALRLRQGGRYIDCTLGEGGHAQAILGQRQLGVRLLGLDMDGEAIGVARERLAEFGDAAALVETSYVNIVEAASDWGFLPCDGVLFDLGASSLQLDSGERGFSFLRDGPLDMRFGRGAPRTALEIVNETDPDDLADLIYRLGEERRSRRIARVIANARPIETTAQLSEAIIRAVGWPSRRRRGIHPATRAFQALRMAVNDEVENIERGAREAVRALNAGGRLVIISYHSIEDRIVKGILRELSSPKEADDSPALRLIQRKVIKPQSEEVESNPRIRSARMRVAERT